MHVAQQPKNFQQMSLKEKLEYFKSKQNELVGLEAELGKLQKEFQEQAHVQKLIKEFQEKTETNKAELQLAFGLTPGKPLSVVDLLSNVSELVK